MYSKVVKKYESQMKPCFEGGVEFADYYYCGQHFSNDQLIEKTPVINYSSNIYSYQNQTSIVKKSRENELDNMQVNNIYMDSDYEMNNGYYLYDSLFKSYQSGKIPKSRYKRLIANERERRRMQGLNNAFNR